MRIGYRRVSSHDQSLERQELKGAERVFEESVLRRGAVLPLRDGERVRPAAAAADGCLRRIRAGDDPPAPTAAAAGSMRRREIVEMHASGLRPATIARRLGISSSTVWRHLADERRLRPALDHPAQRPAVRPPGDGLRRGTASSAGCWRMSPHRTWCVALVKSLKCWIIWRGAPLFSGC